MQNQSNTITVDIAIIGGGIAGLWTLNILRQAGYQAVLLESDAIGSGQTIKAQGIIHGGLKYALSGALTEEAKALSSMPMLWQRCLQGQGEIDLSSVSILSNAQYLWSNNSITSKIASFFASKTLINQVKFVTGKDRPDIFINKNFKGHVYKLNEIVISIPSLLNVLIKKYKNNCIKINKYQLNLNNTNNSIACLSLPINNDNLLLKAKHYVFAAGEGNGKIMTVNNININMQLRPLHMVMVKQPDLPDLYGHCITANIIPKITITTHIAQDGEKVWYLGGQLAEQGVNYSSEQQINFAQKELSTLFPWLNLTKAKWASFYVNRAEAEQVNGKKPVNSVIYTKENFSIGWPTKLALAPIFANQIYNIIKANNIKPATNPSILPNLPNPSLAVPMWDQLLCT